MSISFVTMTGLSLTAAAQAARALKLNDIRQLQIVHATAWEDQHAPHLDVDVPAMIAGVTLDNLARIQGILLNAYPASHPLTLVSIIETNALITWRGVLGEAQAAMPDRRELADAPFSSNDLILYCPALPQPGSVASLEGVMATLLSPQGCPWDREQTHLSLRKYLLEETYEVLDALDSDDMTKLSEELGDLLLQVVFHAQIATRDGEFRMADVVNHIVSKLIRRHPHVFGEIEVANSEEVTLNWERLKAQERASAGQRAADPFAGISLALPALTRAQEMQRRAERFGFQWPDRAAAWAKFQEEMAEWMAADTPANQHHEFGDVLATLVNVARWDGVDAESALREANNRFSHRFTRLLAHCEAEGIDPRTLTTDEMLRRWREIRDNH